MLIPPYSGVESTPITIYYTIFHPFLPWGKILIVSQVFAALKQTPLSCERGVGNLLPQAPPIASLIQLPCALHVQRRGRPADKADGLSHSSRRCPSLYKGLADPQLILDVKWDGLVPLL